MSNCDKLLRRAKDAPNGVRMEQACKLAECYGFVKSKNTGKGSHVIYKRKSYPHHLNFQERSDGKVKAYQIKQLLAAIDEVDTGEKRPK